jgi:hypothetical protein
MRIAAIGDRHIDRQSPRYQHALKMWSVAINDAVTRGAGHIVHVGDACEGDPDGLERLVMGEIYLGACGEHMDGGEQTLRGKAWHGTARRGLARQGEAWHPHGSGGSRHEH